MAKDKSNEHETIDVSLTSFADFVLKAGLSKLTVAQEIRKQYERGYNPAFDYYKKFRDAVRRLHEEGAPISELGDFGASVEEPNKRVNYEILCRGYTKFWSVHLQEHGQQWMAPARGEWGFGRVRVRVTPELAFSDGSTNYLLKMHLKDEPLVRPQVQVILHLMQLALRPQVKRPVVAILDVRRSKLFEATAFNPKWTVVLEAETLSFERMYQQSAAMAEITD